VKSWSIEAHHPVSKEGETRRIWSVAPGSIYMQPKIFAPVTMLELEQKTGGPLSLSLMTHDSFQCLWRRPYYDLLNLGLVAAVRVTEVIKIKIKIKSYMIFSHPDSKR